MNSGIQARPHMSLKWVRPSTWLIGLYFGLAPLDMVSDVWGTGTVLKYLGLAIMFTIVTEMIVFSRRMVLVLSRQFWLLYCYVLLLIGSMMWSFQYQPRAIDAAITLGSHLVFFVLMTSRQYTLEEFNIIELVTILGAAAIAVAIVTNPSMRASSGRATLAVVGALSDPNNVGANLIMPTVFCAGRIGWSIKQRSWRSIPLIAVLVLLVYTVLITGSRGATIAIIFGIVSCVLMQRHRTGFKVISAGLAVLIVVILISYLPGIIRARFTVARIIEDKGGARFVLWSNVIRVVSEASIGRMIFGYGLSNSTSVMAHATGMALAPHNLFLQSLLDGGFISVLILVGVMISMIRKSRMNGNLVGLCALLSTIVMALSIDCFVKKFLWNAFAVAAIRITDSTAHNAKIEMRTG